MKLIFESVDKALLNKIEAILDEAEQMKNAYFFKSPKSAGERRSYEKKHSHDEVTWEEGGHTYTASYTVSCSVNNVYASGNYTKDGKKTTITAIKNSYNRMKEE